MSMNTNPSQVFQSQRPTLQKQLQKISSDCTQCQRCVAECRFLQKHGDPKTMADAYDPEDIQSLGQAFECSLCELCTAVCPETLDLRSMFLEMRREAFDRGAGIYPQHDGLRNYEAKGTSQRFSWYALPEDCETIFFPGCGLPGTRPEQTLKTFELLQRNMPTAGIVLDCCTKPSHDLGRQEHFLAMFGEMKQFLAEHGIRTVLVACPNCAKVFNEYGPEFESRTVYEYLDGTELPQTRTVSGTVTIHDPCVARFSEPTHEAVRNLVTKKGLQVVETLHTKKTTLCCGKGGAADSLAPVLPMGFSEKQVQEADGNRTITYCTGCANRLGDFEPASHLLDLVFAPEESMAGKLKVPRAPVTYFNRLKVKKHLQRHFAAAVTRERTFTGRAESTRGLLKKLPILATIVGAIVAVWVTK